MCARPVVGLLCEFQVISIDEIGTLLSILWGFGYVWRRSVKRWDAHEQKSARSVVVHFIHISKIGVDQLWNAYCRICVLEGKLDAVH